MVRGSPTDRRQPPATGPPKPAQNRVEGAGAPLPEATEAAAPPGCDWEPGARRSCTCFLMAPARPPAHVPGARAPWTSAVAVAAAFGVTTSSKLTLASGPRSQEPKAS